MSDTPQSITCPYDGESLFEGLDEYYCWECETFYCPLCMSALEIYSATGTGSACSHYIADYFASLMRYNDYFQRDGDHLTFYSESSISGLLPPKTIASLLDKLEEEEAEAVKAMISDPSKPEIAQMFGELFEWSQSESFFSFDYLCDFLNVPIFRSYQNESPDMAQNTYIAIYFTPMGGDLAWEILRPALDKHREGMIWLTAQLTTLEDL